MQTEVLRWFRSVFSWQAMDSGGNLLPARTEWYEPRTERDGFGAADAGTAPLLPGCLLDLTWEIESQLEVERTYDGPHNVTVRSNGPLALKLINNSQFPERETSTTLIMYKCLGILRRSDKGSSPSLPLKEFQGISVSATVEG